MERMERKSRGPVTPEQIVDMVPADLAGMLGDSILPMAEDEEYGSDFKWMMGLIDSLSDMKELSTLNDICICHAIYNLTDINLFSYQDVLRMNDFWCEVRVTHQLLTDLEGKRYSCILNRANK